MSSHRPALSVNLNKVALLRNTRPSGIPDVEHAARLALEAGAAGITVHPRPDGRHIRPDDVPRLAALVAEYPGREYNIEGNPFTGPDAIDAAHGYPGFVPLVRAAKEAGGVHQATLVPDAPGQATSDHGWDLHREGARLAPVVAELQAMGCRVSLFVDPDPGAMPLAAASGADRVELYTEPYADAFASGEQDRWLERYAETARAAAAAGLGVNAGHDLNLANLPRFVAAVPELLEVSIGHALTADALWMGLPEAVQAYLRALGA